MRTLKNLIIFIVLGLLLTHCRLNTTTDLQKDEKWELVWQDEFNYTGLPDSIMWKYDTEGNEAGWGNHEAQYYTEADKDNAWVEKGILSITARNENQNGKDFTSARLVSQADWQYGKIEVNAKLPSGRGTWSAIWMMPGGWSFNDGNWPDIGELDIMEHVGHDPGVIHASAHSKDYQWYLFFEFAFAIGNL